MKFHVKICPKYLIPSNIFPLDKEYYIEYVLKLEKMRCFGTRIVWVFMFSNVIYNIILEWLSPLNIDVIGKLY